MSKDKRFLTDMIYGLVESLKSLFCHLRPRWDTKISHTDSNSSDVWSDLPTETLLLPSILRCLSHLLECHMSQKDLGVPWYGRIQKWVLQWVHLNDERWPLYVLLLWTFMQHKTHHCSTCICFWPFTCTFKRNRAPSKPLKYTNRFRFLFPASSRSRLTSLSLTKTACDLSKLSSLCR